MLAYILGTFLPRSRSRSTAKQFARRQEGRLRDGARQAEEAHKNADVAAIDTAMGELNAAWQAASQDIYAAQQQAQGALPGADAGQQSQSNAGGQQGGGDGQPEDAAV